MLHAVEHDKAHVHTILQSGNEANAALDMMTNAVVMSDRAKSVFMRYLEWFRDIIINAIRLS